MSGIYKEHPSLPHDNELFVTLFPSGEWGVNTWNSKVELFNTLPALMRWLSKNIVEHERGVNRLRIVLERI